MSRIALSLRAVQLHLGTFFLWGHQIGTLLKNSTISYFGNLVSYYPDLEVIDLSNSQYWLQINACWLIDQPEQHHLQSPFKLVSAPLEVLDFENLLQLDLSDNFIQVLTQTVSFWKIGQYNFKKLPAEYEYLTATLFIDGNLLLCDCSLVNIFRSVSYVDSPNSPECVSQGLGSNTCYHAKEFWLFCEPKKDNFKNTTFLFF